jgi:hypothetical protein
MSLVAAGALLVATGSAVALMGGALMTGGALVGVLDAEEPEPQLASSRAVMQNITHKET